MGEHNVDQQFDERKSQAFMKALLEDLRALEYMIETGGFETGVARIGAEQEMFLVDRNMRPAPISLEVLDHANDSRLTTEIARFNLEANLTPLPLTGRCFRLMEQELEELLGLVHKSAETFRADVLLSGILPTLQKSDLTLENLTPLPRYSQLNDGVIGLRGGPFSIHIKGPGRTPDHARQHHDGIVQHKFPGAFSDESQPSLRRITTWPRRSRLRCWQRQLTPLSCLVTGYGRKRVWRCSNTRPTLVPAQLARSQPTRVSFGDKWLKNSVVELFHDQISRFRPIMITQPDEDPFQVLARGETPLLSALRMHNGTVWRWNRACYGVADGIAHLRIENRALPSGPTVQDEMANTAFFVGLMVALPHEYGEIAKRLSFDDAKENFFAAARHGLNAQLRWLDGKSLSATSLILNELLPLARRPSSGSGRCKRYR